MVWAGGFLRVEVFYDCSKFGKGEMNGGGGVWEWRGSERWI